MPAPGLSARPAAADRVARVKICGVATVQAYEAAAEAGADWVGFVFFDRSPRWVTPAQAARIGAPGGPAKVGLFVEPTDDELSRALDTVPLAALQPRGPAGPSGPAAPASRCGARLGCRPPATCRPMRAPPPPSSWSPGRRPAPDVRVAWR